MDRTGLMLVNLGTPDSPGTSDVRRYLREFLSDPRVLDINPVLRAFLLNAIILPFRPKESGEAYSKIWTDAGSPLLVYGRELVQKVAERVGPQVHVELAMRYQNPSIASALERFRREGIDRIVVFPLFPQYSSAAYGSAVEKIYEEASKHWNTPYVDVVPAYYDHPAFISSFAHVSRPVIDDLRPEVVVMSFHGVPERHVTKSDEAGGTHCLQSSNCCDAIVPANRNCYRAQCFATARALAAELGLADDAWEITFQSRLGRDPWIQPYTDVRIEKLAEQGVKRVAVACPAFVADCLETLEEIGMRALEDFRARGGEDLRLIPSLNAEDVWADAVVQITREHAVLPEPARSGDGPAVVGGRSGE